MLPYICDILKSFKDIEIVKISLILIKILIYMIDYLLLIIIIIISIIFF
jgi:hypothetical protein